MKNTIKIEGKERSFNTTVTNARIENNTGIVKSVGRASYFQQVIETMATAVRNEMSELKTLFVNPADFCLFWLNNENKVKEYAQALENNGFAFKSSSLKGFGGISSTIQSRQATTLLRMLNLHFPDYRNLKKSDSNFSVIIDDFMQGLKAVYSDALQIAKNDNDKSYEKKRLGQLETIWVNFESQNALMKKAKDTKNKAKDTKNKAKDTITLVEKTSA